jgi:ankyrin repeat protein
MSRKVQHFIDAYNKDIPRLEQLRKGPSARPLLCTKFTDNHTIFHYAAAKGEPLLRACLICSNNLGLTNEEVGLNAVSDIGLTPLMAATIFRRCSNMKALILHGADPFYKGVRGFPLIFDALTSCETTMVLYEHDPTLFSQKGPKDMSVWHALSCFKHVPLEVFHLLCRLDIGVPIDAKSTSKYETALAYAIAKGHRELAKEMLREGAQLSLALPSLGPNVPDWVVLLALQVKDEQIKGMSQTIDVIAEACYELSHKKPRTDDNE